MPSITTYRFVNRRNPTQGALLRGLGLSLLLVLCQCASRQSTEEKAAEKLLDRLTLFVEAVQADQWDRALNAVSAVEKRALLGDGASLSEPTKIKLKALKLSTLAHRGKVYLVKDKLEGIHQVLPGGLPAASGLVPEKSDEEVPSFQ